jgi:signal transduction histidine kinase/CheY-like chemotaxis protein
VAVAVIRATSPEATGAELATFGLGVVLFPLGAAALVGRGSTRPAAIVLLVGAALTLLVGVARTGGLASPSAAWVVTIPFASGFFLGRGSALPAAAAALGVVGLLSLGHATGLLPALPVADLAYHTTTLSGLLAFTALVARLHEWSAARARAAEEDAAALADLIAAQAGTGAVVVVEGTVRWVNDAALGLLGRPRAETLGRRWDTLVPSVALPLPNGRPNRVELDDAFPGGARHVELRNEPVFTARGPRLLVTLTDQTERVAAARARLRMEARLAESERLESLGRIAGGVAHDFNNLLVGILCNAELLRGQDSAEGEEAVRDIIVAAENAAGLVGQLLAYAGRGRAVLQEIDAVAAVREAARLSEAARRRPRVCCTEGLDAAALWADPALFSQVCTNLLTNAIDATPAEAGPGAVRVRVDRVDADAALLAQDRLPGDPPPPGRFVRITVADSGAGIAESDQGRLFEPFFTTKASGRGLGLAAVQGIVKRLGGALLLESAPGRGARFTVLLPADAPRPAAGALAQPDAPDAPAGPRAPAPPILVVDDDPLARQQLVRVLRRAGWDTAEAGSAGEALQALSAAPRPFAAALIDDLMPDLDGPEAGRALRRAHPEVPLILCMSGPLRPAPREFSAALAKPCAPDVLVAAVARACGVSAS